MGKIAYCIIVIVIELQLSDYKGIKNCCVGHQFHPFLFHIEAINFIGKSHTFKTEII